MADRIGPRLVALIKAADYLLDASHPEGGPKARFFLQFGFDRNAPEALISALRDHPDANEVVETIEGESGTKHIVQCHLATPDGRNPCVRTVWLRDKGSDLHRLVTAYPARR